MNIRMDSRIAAAAVGALIAGGSFPAAAFARTAEEPLAVSFTLGEEAIRHPRSIDIDLDARPVQAAPPPWMKSEYIFTAKEKQLLDDIRVKLAALRDQHPLYETVRKFGEKVHDATIAPNLIRLLDAMIAEKDYTEFAGQIPDAGMALSAILRSSEPDAGTLKAFDEFAASFNALIEEMQKENRR